ncbi:hypothetical protein [uncultured Croceitalea sp.]|uniref:hypothetical protein n=1 Tax=uncultured Croceitalea sp. TaxID=1798908 RepID=UPI00330689C0
MIKGVYTLKKYLGNSEYGNFSGNLVTKNLDSSSRIEFNLFEGRRENPNQYFSELLLPNESHEDLIKLLEYYALTDFENEFLCLVANVQNTYLLYKESFDIPMSGEFLGIGDDIVKLIDALERYLFKKPTDTFSISFKKQNRDSITLKNTFIVNEVHNLLLNKYGMSKDNFQQIKNELLEQNTVFDYRKGGSYVLSNIVRSLTNFVLTCVEKNISENEALRFCGVFLHICQIPSNNNEDEGNIGVKYSLYDNNDLVYTKESSCLDRCFLKETLY